MSINLLEKIKKKKNDIFGDQYAHPKSSHEITFLGLASMKTNIFSNIQMQMMFFITFRNFKNNFFRKVQRTFFFVTSPKVENLAQKSSLFYFIEKEPKPI
jgi:hypothetical protein